MMILRWIWDNLSSLLLAFVLALTVWVAAVNSEDPIEERTFPNAIPIEVRNQPAGMLIVEEPQANARISLRAPRSVWNQLSADDISVWIDLSDAQAGRLELELQRNVRQEPVQVTGLEPGSVSLELEPAASKQLPIDVQVNGEPAIGYRANTPTIEPSQATISGPQSNVDRVIRAVVEVDISGRSTDFNQAVRLQPIDAEGQPVGDVDVQPITAEVSISVEDLGGYRSVVVLPRIEGEVEPGYQLTRITVSPTLVRVFAPDPQVINELSSFVETEPVELSGATEDFERRVSLNLPEGVSIVGEPSVVVRVSIDPIENSITLSRPVELQGLGQDLFATASPDSVNLILFGPVPILDEIGPDDVRVVVDLLGLEIGTHQLEPEIIVASPDVRVQSVLPDTIEVTISDTPPPTATPVPEGE
ncbi:MAG: CdaR family protein [Anaerolineales bacterium]|nr:CdaR family protein [Anaerolineales bacterium]